MPVSVPRLNRIEPTNTQAPNDRINMKVNDSSSAIMGQTNAITSVGNKVGDIYQKYEDDKITQLSNVAEQEYSSWNKQALAKLKTYEGDPTDAYAEYDKQAVEKRQAILDARPDLNDRVKRHLTTHVDSVVGKAGVEADFQRGQQQEVYANNVFESTVKLKKDNLPVSAGYIQKGDPTSYAMFDDSMSDIKTLIAKRGLTKGTVERLPDDAEKYTHSYTDEDGKLVKVNMTDIAKQKVAKELSEGVRSSIDVMISGGRVEEAKDMHERYKGYITTADRVKLENKFKTAGRKDEAYSVIGTLKGKSEEAQIAAINNIQDPELRSEALKIKDADDRRITAMKKRKEDTNSDKLTDHVLQKMNSDQPFYGIADLENDPVFKGTFDNMSPKQKKAVLEMVDAPKDSNPKSLLGVQEVFLSGDGSLETMSPREMEEKLAGLSKADKNKYRSMYMSMRTQTEGEKRAMYAQAGKMLQDQFIADGHIKRNLYGKIAGEDEVTYINDRNELMDHLSKQTGTFNPAQLQKFVKEYSAAKIKGNVFNPPSRVAPKTETPKGGQIKISRTQYNNLVRLYSKQNNGTIPDQKSPEFINFVQKNL